jgi:hypothetical protein
MELLLDVREEQANFIIELLQKFEFVNIKNKTEKSPYNQEFVDRILASEKSMLSGKRKKITLDDVWK